MQEQHSSARAHAGSSRAADLSLRPRRPEPISPELALVDPALAAAAREALPAEPWNAALDRALGGHRPLPGETVPLAVAPAGRPERAPVDSGLPRRPRLGAAAARRLALVAVWVVMVTSLALLAEVRAPGGPAVGAEASSGAPARPALPTPVPSGGYVIGARSGFRVGPQGRAIGGMTVPVRCLRGVRLPRMPVTAAKGFSYHGVLRGSSGQRVRVSLEGRFESPRTARGTVEVEGRGCTDRTVTFRARLS